MNDPIERMEVATALADSARAIGTLAANDAAFRAAVAAFRASDAAAFQKALDIVKLRLDCELVCFWLRSKECVLVCLELCGPPKNPITVEHIPQLIPLIARLAEDPAMVKRIVAVVEKRDAQGWAAIVKELKAEAFCHLLCHWVCMVHWRLVCRVVCSPVRIPIHSFATELQAAAAAVSRAFKDPARLKAVIEASLAFKCETLAGLFGKDGDCILLCEWICSWRCILVCLPLCRAFPPIAPSVDEMVAFARAITPLATQPDAINQLMSAVLAQNVDVFTGLVKQFKLEAYCIQLCHWICFAICRRFCICVCPPVATIPLFTHVGSYKITTDFTADGTTTVGNLAFTGTIPLIGILPDGTAPDALEYRFRTEKYPLGGGPVDVIAAMIPATRIGELEYREWDSVGLNWFTNSADYWVNHSNPLLTVSINQQFGPPLVVPVNNVVKAGGWIEVPQVDNLINGGVGRFIPNTGVMINLDTTKLSNEVFGTPGVPLPLLAGDSVPPANQSERPHFKIYFEAQKVLGAVSVGANNLAKIAISNTHFSYIRHPDWAGGLVNPPDVMFLSLDVQELLSIGCKPLTTDVHALFTAYHPYLGTCKVYIEGPAVPPLPAPVFPAISAIGQAKSPPPPPVLIPGQAFNITAQKPCAYIVWIEATLRLTSGYGGVYGTFSDHIAFCKR